MGGGFRSVRPASALERGGGKKQDCQNPSSREIAQQFAIMSVRVRGLVPTFPDGTQAVVERRVPKVSRAVGAAARSSGRMGSAGTKSGVARRPTASQDKAILSLSGDICLSLPHAARPDFKIAPLNKRKSRSALPSYVEDHAQVHVIFAAYIMCETGEGLGYNLRYRECALALFAPTTMLPPKPGSRVETAAHNSVRLPPLFQNRRFEPFSAVWGPPGGGGRRDRPCGPPPPPPTPRDAAGAWDTPTHAKYTGTHK